MSRLAEDWPVVFMEGRVVGADECGAPRDLGPFGGRETRKPRRGGAFDEVDPRGFEPLTSWVRSRRAPNCATGPRDRSIPAGPIRRPGLRRAAGLVGQPGLRGGEAAGGGRRAVL